MQRTDSNSAIREAGRCESPQLDTCEEASTTSVVNPFRTFKIDTMAEAQRLIGISLAKIAQSRVCRGGVSLHKNLLVATVLQKARYIFMEEAYHIVHGHYLQQNKCMELEMEKQRNAAAAAAAAASVNSNVDDESCSESEDSDESESYASSETNDESDNEDKENSPPSSQNANETREDAPEVHTETSPSYFDMDVKKVEKENSGNKRRREATEWETEEAVQSILPKRLKSESDAEQSTNEPASTADATALSETVTSQLEAEDLSRQSEGATTNTLPHTPSVESIDRITSLVSIFSFGNLSRSVSTPDFCAAQAKDTDNSLTQLQHSQRGYLTMTV